ncbi:hypothetical protein NDU88_005364 [Pleurodeles waltl]|uniref:Uncharacterized protein n=1 Tax=Pleurodeles waltl TaxID=8319 RepID=A0AAV7RJY3_PLEWA|nr:hypothetical protein NDU88_005364 [Pleurodeles waltl]
MHGGSSWFPHPAVGCSCGALIAPVLRPHSGSRTVYLSGTGSASPPVGAPGGQSHHARACIVTSVPGLGVGLQAAGASLLRHLQ